MKAIMEVTLKTCEDDDKYDWQHHTTLAVPIHGPATHDRISTALRQLADWFDEIYKDDEE